MKKRILSVLLAFVLLLSYSAVAIIPVSADVTSDEKQLYHLAIEDQLFGSYNWGESIGVAFPDNAMAAFYGWGERTIDSLYNGGGWTASGNVIRTYNYSYITALGDVYMDATQLSASLGNRGESSAPRGVQLWKINGVTDITDNANITTAMANQANWEMVAEVIVTADKPAALSDGKGFNWTTLVEPVLVSPEEIYVIAVEQGAGAAPGVSWGNPRANEINNVLAVHPDNVASEVGEVAAQNDFYVSGALIGTYGGNLVEFQNALAGSMYCGGNFKYEAVSKSVYAAPEAGEIIDTSATVTWAEAADSTVFGTVAGYRILVSENGAEPVISYTEGKTATSLELTGLTPGTPYSVEVIAVDGITAEGATVATYSAGSFTTNNPAATPTIEATPTTEAVSDTASDDVQTGDSSVNGTIMLLLAAFAIMFVVGKRTFVKN